MENENPNQPSSGEETPVYTKADLQKVVEQRQIQKSKRRAAERLALNEVSADLERIQASNAELAERLEAAKLAEEWAPVDAAKRRETQESELAAIRAEKLELKAEIERQQVGTLAEQYGNSLDPLGRNIGVNVVRLGLQAGALNGTLSPRDIADLTLEDILGANNPKD